MAHEDVFKHFYRQGDRPGIVIIDAEKQTMSHYPHPSDFDVEQAAQETGIPFSELFNTLDQGADGKNHTLMIDMVKRRAALGNQN